MSKNLLNDFYPISNTMCDCPSGIWQVGMVVKLTEHLAAAKSGDRERESKLINRLGQLRRNTSSLNTLNTTLVDVVKQSADFLRSTGRSVNFAHEDPRYWITARDGKTPRW